MKFSPFPKMRANLAIILGTLDNIESFNALAEQADWETHEGVIKSCIHSLALYKDFGARNYILDLKKRFPGTSIEALCIEALERLNDHSPLEAPLA